MKTSSNDRTPTGVPLSKCKRGAVYKLKSRNLSYGVFDGEFGFVGIREKWGHRYIFTEYHWDQGAPFGTVYDVQETKHTLPANIKLCETVGTVDKATGRALTYDRELFHATRRGWRFLDTNEPCGDGVDPQVLPNDLLFQYLDKIQQNETKFPRND